MYHLVYVPHRTAPPIDFKSDSQTAQVIFCRMNAGYFSSNPISLLSANRLRHKCGNRQLGRFRSLIRDKGGANRANIEVLRK